MNFIRMMLKIKVEVSVRGMIHGRLNQIFFLVDKGAGGNFSRARKGLCLSVEMSSV